MVPWSEAVDKQGHTGKRPDRDASQLTILALIPNSRSTDLYLASFCTTLGRRLLSSVFFFFFVSAAVGIDYTEAPFLLNASTRCSGVSLFLKELWRV